MYVVVKAEPRSARSASVYIYNRVSRSVFNGRTYLWASGSGGGSSLSVEEGVAVVEVYAALSRRRGRMFTYLARIRDGARYEHEHFVLHNVEVLEELDGDRLLYYQTRMLNEGYSMARDPTKARLNIYGYILAAHGAPVQTKEQSPDTALAEILEKVRKLDKQHLETLITEIAAAIRRGELPKIGREAVEELLNSLTT